MNARDGFRVSTGCSRPAVSVSTGYAGRPTAMSISARKTALNSSRGDTGGYDQQQYKATGRMLKHGIKCNCRTASNKTAAPKLGAAVVPHAA